jgi:integrase
VKLTKRAVDAVRSDSSDVFEWDGELPGFGLRVKPSGRKSYLIQYRADGRTRRVTLGPHGVLTAEQARERAARLLSGVRDGANPSEERATARATETVSELCDRYLEHYARVHKKVSSIRSDESLIAKYIRPAFGKLKVPAVERADVQRLHHSMKDMPYQANRMRALMSKMMNLAERWGLRRDGSNPCRHVTKYRESGRERFLSAAELAKLGGVLREVERERVEVPSVVPAIRLLLFTGARVGEILTLRWEHVDLERRVLLLPDSKTGAKAIHLSPAAAQILAGLPRKGNPWVIRGRDEGNPLLNLSKPWKEIRARAGVADVRIHDLRHSFASVAAATGSSLPVIGALLGHKQPQTTARYAHLAADPLQQAVDAAGARLLASMAAEDESAGNVVSLRRKATQRKQRG